MFAAGPEFVVTDLIARSGQSALTTDRNRGKSSQLEVAAIWQTCVQNKPRLIAKE